MSDLEMSENEKNDIEVSDDEGSISNPIIKTTSHSYQVMNLDNMFCACDTG